MIGDTYDYKEEKARETEYNPRPHQQTDKRYVRRRVPEFQSGKRVKCRYIIALLRNTRI